jgi:hypothetical protein
MFLLEAGISCTTAVHRHKLTIGSVSATTSIFPTERSKKCCSALLKVLPYMSWFPYDSMRKVVCIAGRQYARQAGGDLVYITQLPHQT